MFRAASCDDDLSSIVASGAVSGLHEPRTSEILGSAIDNGECVVHVDDQDFANGLIITYRRALFGCDFVKLLVVSSELHRCGIGTSLLRHACSNSSTEMIFISTNTSNTAMRNLLRREHWTFSGRLTGVDPGDDELVYWKKSH